MSLEREFAQFQRARKLKLCISFEGNAWVVWEDGEFAVAASDKDLVLQFYKKLRDGEIPPRDGGVSNASR